MHTIAYILAAVAVVGAIISTIAAVPFMQAQQQNDTATPEGNQTTEEVPVVTGNETSEPVNDTAETPPPPTSETEVLTEAGEEGPFNITATQEPDEATIVVSLASLTEGSNNVTIIEPDGNVTEIPDVNVTVVDNDTVVVTPPADNVTTLPESNVTIITPAPEPCGCPADNTTATEEGIAPVIVRPAPGQQVTIEGGEVTVQNETGVVVEGTEDNQTTEPTGNDTGSVQPISSAIKFDSWINI